MNCRKNISLARAHRLSNPGFLCVPGNSNEHDIHNHNAADNKRNAGHSQQNDSVVPNKTIANAGDSIGRPIPEIIFSLGKVSLRCVRIIVRDLRPEFFSADRTWL